MLKKDYPQRVLVGYYWLVYRMVYEEPKLPYNHPLSSVASYLLGYGSWATEDVAKALSK